MTKGITVESRFIIVTGLYYKMSPIKNSVWDDESWSCKRSKGKITVLTCSNTFSSYILAFMVIRKSAKLCRFLCIRKFSFDRTDLLREPKECLDGRCSLQIVVPSFEFAPEVEKHLRKGSKKGHFVSRQCAFTPERKHAT